MRTQEFNEFGKILDELCATWDRPPARDEMRSAYWNALADVSLSEVRQNASRIMRTAVSKQPFPKPGELRNSVPRETTPQQDGAFSAAESFTIRCLNELKRQDEAAWLREVKMRYLDRRVAVEEPGSTFYAQAVSEWHAMRAEMGR